MYEFHPVSPRMEEMHQRVRGRVIRTDSERAMIITHAYEKYEGITPLIKRAMVLRDVCAQMTVRVEENELIVGNRAKHFCGNSIYPEWVAGNGGWIVAAVRSGEWQLCEDGLYHNPDGEELKLTVSEETVRDLESIRDYWKNRTISAPADAWKPDGYDVFAELGVSSYRPGAPLINFPTGHLIAGYDRIIRVGYESIRQRAQAWIDDHEGDLMGEDLEKYLFYKAVTLSAEAGTIQCTRYGEECLRQAAGCSDETRRAELERMGESLKWIAKYPARTFWEAVQGAMMYQLLLWNESRYPAMAFGRFDQYTWPYLKKELEEGTLTEAQAQEIVDAFFLKVNCHYTPSPRAVLQTTGVGNTYQHTTIGGVYPDTGEDASNPVTYMVLESVGRLGLHDPTISLRINRNTPLKLWDCAIETSKRVGGLPLFQNDDVIIPGLMKEVGMSLEDARNYGIIGCQEIVGSGNDYPCPNGVHPPHSSLHFGSILVAALNDGRNPFTGGQAKLHTGYLYEMENMEQVRAAVDQMVRYCNKWQVTVNNYTEYISAHECPHPALSMSVEGCMESGRDVTAGGAKYNSFGGTGTGLATVADSLTTIKYMCFDKKLCTTRQLYDAYMANWEGYEELRQQILNEVPHFGNDDPYADSEMKWITDTYYDSCTECYSKRAQVFKAGLYGASDHIAQGYTTWATPDGRKTGEPIADAASPAQARDKNGPTAVFRSSLCYDHKKFMDGIALNIRIHPTALNSEEGTAKLRDMTRAYMAAGGLEIQYNVVSSETLRKAQEEPDAYRNLVVRIAGYSAYFVELGRDQQNDIISRNENMI